MTFKDVIIKNFKHNFKTYSSFYFCSTFTITMFFIFSTLFYNKALTNFLKEAYVNMVVQMSLIFTFVFAVLFITYVHSSMKKKRAKEFGLLMTFGMTSKDISKIVVVEDMALSCVSMLSGILVGTLFSRLVHMFVNRILELDVPYSLSYKCFIMTIASFIIIFSFVILLGWFNTRRLSISKLLKEERKTEYVSTGSILYTVLGIMMVLVLLVSAFLSISNRKFALNSKIIFSSIMIGLLGTYLVISNVFPKILAFAKSRRSLYNNNMILFAEVKYSMDKNKKLIFLSTLLYSAIICCFALTIAITMNIKTTIDNTKGADVEYIETANINNFPDKDVKRLIKEEKLVFKSEEKFNCLFIWSNELSKESQSPVVALSESTFNKISRIKTVVRKGTVKLSADSMMLPKIQTDSLIFKAGNSSLKFYISAPESTNILSMGMYIVHKYVVLLNDEDYSTIQKLLPSNMNGIIHRYRTNDWEHSRLLLQKVSKLSDNTKRTDNKALLSLGISGNYNGYVIFKKVNSIIMFVFVFMCILFCFAAVLMLLLRQFEALDRTRRKYSQLRKIGMSKKEYGKSIYGEIRFIFMTPVLFGIILAFAFILICIGIFAIPEIQRIIGSAVLLTGIYTLLQLILCMVVGRVYLEKVTE